MVRYMFSRAPCSHPATAEHADIAGPGNCSIYAKAEGLPAPPFLLNATSGSRSEPQLQTAPSGPA